MARALLLDEVERAHLYRLAGLNPPQRYAAPSVPPSPQLQRLLDACAPRPGYVRDRHWNFAVVNEAARVVFGYGETDHSCLVSFFTNARYRAVHWHWAETAPQVVAGFRADAARYPDDPEFDRVAADLAEVSPDFAALWARHDAAAHTSAVVTVDHPRAGLLEFDAPLFPVPAHPGHHLVLHDPRPGTAERLEELMRAVPGGGTPTTS